MRTDESLLLGSFAFRNSTFDSDAASASGLVGLHSPFAANAMVTWGAAGASQEEAINRRESETLNWRDFDVRSTSWLAWKYRT